MTDIHDNRDEDEVSKALSEGKDVDTCPRCGKMFVQIYAYKSFKYCNFCMSEALGGPENFMKFMYGEDQHA